MQGQIVPRRTFLAQFGCCISVAALGCRDRGLVEAPKTRAEKRARNADPSDIVAEASGGLGDLDPSHIHATRTKNLRHLETLGFQVADNLPLWTKVTLRPIRQIAVRLMALDAVYTWAYAIEEKASSERLRAYVQRNRLIDAMTGEDREVFQTARANAQRDFGNTVGWCLENMWCLAWILGFEPTPPVSDEVISDNIANSLMMQFMPKLDATVDDLLRSVKIRDTPEIVALHDMYYCAHNAVRNSQIGRNTVPAGFDLVVGESIVRERRHALTWSLCPGIAWDETDLST